MILSVVIPAHNEEGCIEGTVRELHGLLRTEEIEHEILVVNDHSKDSTAELLADLAMEIDEVRYVDNELPGGFGYAIRYGLARFRGDAVIVMMADKSDSPEDVVRFWRTFEEKRVDCVFGSRFIKGGFTRDYPALKMMLNRFANFFVRVLFGLRYNDITNAFKLYHREVIEGVQPILSAHFNLTVELPLKAIIRGFSYEVIPNGWHNRTTGVSKLKIREMGSRYLFIVLYCFVEKWLSRGDYKRGKLAVSSTLRDEEEAVKPEEGLTTQENRVPERELKIN